jgi:hypothetical protein
MFSRESHHGAAFWAALFVWHNGARMPWQIDPAMQTLRLTYNAAVAAYADASRALAEALMRGDSPTAHVIETERKAKLRLDEARRKLHQAMKSGITGDP